MDTPKRKVFSWETLLYGVRYVAYLSTTSNWSVDSCRKSWGSIFVFIHSVSSDCVLFCSIWLTWHSLSFFLSLSFVYCVVPLYLFHIKGKGLLRQNLVGGVNVRIIKLVWGFICMWTVWNWKVMWRRKREMMTRFVICICGLSLVCRGGKEKCHLISWLKGGKHLRYLARTFRETSQKILKCIRDQLLTRVERGLYLSQGRIFPRILVLLLPSSSRHSRLWWSSHGNHLR